MRNHLMFGILILNGLAGCAGGGGKAGVGVDDITVSDCLSARPGLPESDAVADTASAPSALTATASGGGAVAVLHENYAAECCVGFDVSAEADSAASTVTVTYEETGDPCDCMCVYNLGYTLTDLTPGDWTITAGGDSTTVTVE